MVCCIVPSASAVGRSCRAPKHRPQRAAQHARAHPSSHAAAHARMPRHQPCMQPEHPTCSMGAHSVLSRTCMTRMGAHTQSTCPWFMALQQRELTPPLPFCFFPLQHGRILWLRCSLLSGQRGPQPHPGRHHHRYGLRSLQRPLLPGETAHAHVRMHGHMHAHMQAGALGCRSLLFGFSRAHVAACMHGPCICCLFCQVRSRMCGHTRCMHGLWVAGPACQARVSRMVIVDAPSMCAPCTHSCAWATWSTPPILACHAGSCWLGHASM